jgi:phosphate transport system substrate-binding protein
MNKLVLLLPALALLAGCGDGSQSSGGSGSGRAIWAAGSSTVAPFAARVSENFQQKSGRPAPRVETLGTGGGIKLFCSGVGANTPDIANASRRMKASEFDLCARNGVGEIVEIKVGADGIVIAGERSGPAFDFRLQDIYNGLAAEIPRGGGFAPNPNRTWRDVRADLPAQRIQVYGPPPTSGTRDAFVELGMEAGAEELPALAALKKSEEDDFKQRAGSLREDGGWIDAGENDNAMVQILTRTPGSLGVFGYSFLEQNRDQVRAAAIDGVAPTNEAIQDGSYPLSRSLYIYVKKAHVGVTPGLKEFAQEFVSDSAVGRGGYLLDRGLIPLPQEGVLATRAAVAALAPMPRPES